MTIVQVQISKQYEHKTDKVNESYKPLHQQVYSPL
jgi:hypothetical protein